MSEVKLTVIDGARWIEGSIHGGEVPRAVAALAADPETIVEFDAALRRFFDSHGDADPHGPLSSFASHDLAQGRLDSMPRRQPRDAGMVIIDLAAQVIVDGSTYSSLATIGSVRTDPGGVHVAYRLAYGWTICDHCSESEAEDWRRIAEQRRRRRAAQPRFDVRQVLFGKPLIEFLVDQSLADRDRPADDAIKAVHARWLTTEREDLGGQSPREVLLDGHERLRDDLESRERQWADSRRCPPALSKNAAAYRFSPFGTSEIVVYYDLVRHLITACRERLGADGKLNRRDEVTRLGRLRDAWLATPQPEFNDLTPHAVMENQRRRLPEGQTGAEAIADCDCPICQLIAEDDGVYFWAVDSFHLDDEFEFSLYPTREAWEADRPLSDELPVENTADPLPERDNVANDDGVWQRCFADDDLLTDLPFGQFVQVAMFGFAAMIGELNQDLLDFSTDSAAGVSQQRTFNSLLANLRIALHESPELIDPALDRLAQELEQAANHLPAIRAKCDDLIRRIEEFPDRLAASAALGQLPS